MPELIAFAIVIAPIALLFAAFWRSSSERAHREAARQQRKENDMDAFLYHVYSEPDVLEWVARVHWEQKRTMGSGNGRVSDDDLA